MELTPQEIAEIEELMEHSQDESAPSKSFQQLLQENPHQKGGLAQLAAAEQQALSRSTVGPPAPSTPSTSAPKV